jgi:hypothetical protein
LNISRQLLLANSLHANNHSIAKINPTFISNLIEQKDQ